ncbi:uncharacterized protein LOC116298828 [Actinia tenebrosa]|uniref:Uncharacterized protein LOC116298828 n=1 Tax=Actinia tenebrosa TaxID=6105 RepID=A0A6P8I5P3_ACTTE|nr:uncharacterized protein LOC116298828 [Actinia tenebrosa]
MKDNLTDNLLPKILQYCKQKKTASHILNDMDAAISLGEIPEKECQERASLYMVANHILKKGGGRKGSSSELLLKLVKGGESMEDIIKNTVTPTIILGGDSMSQIDVMCVAAEKEVICEMSGKGRIAEAVVLLVCVYFVFNFDYLKKFDDFFPKHYVAIFKY